LNRLHSREYERYLFAFSLLVPFPPSFGDIVAVFPADDYDVLSPPVLRPLKVVCSSSLMMTLPDVWNMFPVPCSSVYLQVPLSLLSDDVSTALPIMALLMIDWLNLAAAYRPLPDYRR